MEEKRLVEELADVEREQKGAQEVLKMHEEEKKRLEEEEERYWREYCTHRAQLTAMEDENRRYCSQLLLVLARAIRFTNKINHLNLTLDFFYTCNMVI